MIILGIETSCDETSAAVLDVNKGLFVLSNVVASQIDIHAKTGGVVPEVAAREHVTAIIPTIDEALKKANITPDELDVIAVTKGPGLIPALLVGLETAKTLSWAWNKPIVGVNHLAGHVYANWLDMDRTIEFPVLALIVSGGHTEIVFMHSPEQFELLGQTRDDAAGEAFDKIAKLLGLPYPGGPAISKLARNGDAAAFDLPRPMIKTKNYDFSFSGLKTAVLYTIKSLSEIDDTTRANLAASAQQAIVDVLVSKTMRAVKEHEPKSILLAGGVAANALLRETLKEKIVSAQFFCPPIPYCMDNGAMIAAAGYFAHTFGKKAGIELDADPHLPL